MQQGHATALVASEAVARITNASRAPADAATRHFLYVAFSAVHAPMLPPPSFRELWPSDHRADVAKGAPRRRNTRPRRKGSTRGG